MEIMSRAVIKTRHLKPLPCEITSAAISNATLPVKIEAARRAIALCTDLPELLRYKSQAEGLAAAVRTIKEVGPESIRAINECVADAWRKGGELLLRYSNVARPSKRGSILSERGKISRQLGLCANDRASMLRIAAAPKDVVYNIGQKSHGLQGVANLLPRVKAPSSRRQFGAPKYSDSVRIIMGFQGTGITVAHGCLRRVPLDAFQHLTPDERKIIKAKIVEIQELLDEMDRRCR
jgi:hypothetical protein